VPANPESNPNEDVRKANPFFSIPALALRARPE